MGFRPGRGGVAYFLDQICSTELANVLRRGKMICFVFMKTAGFPCRKTGQLAKTVQRVAD
jgi:hypothetical protein